MSQTIPIEEAAAHLVELVSTLRPGDEITLTSHDQAVATITPKKPRRERRFGTCKGMMTVIKEDDEHLADFKDYMY